MLEDPKSENIVLYKNDPSALYTVSETALKQGPQSRVFEKEMISSKINGMIDGTITVYGSYFSVTCSLYVYPGKNLVGTVTEVGSLRDCASVVRNVAAYLGPLITNQLPVELFFEIDEIQKKDCVGKAECIQDQCYHIGNYNSQQDRDDLKHTFSPDIKDDNNC